MLILEDECHEKSTHELTNFVYKTFSPAPATTQFVLIISGSII
ncbi:hypothetical protein BVRB_5g115630 [Beta vulgaris subsp. vulgaris]|nr:hypothetical protein BVRB_5g115630 [Beta vulgaris subsp. vulgaris]